MPRAKYAKPLDPAAAVANRWAMDPAKPANPWATAADPDVAGSAGPSDRIAPSACYRSSLVRPPQRSRSLPRARAIARLGVALLLPALGCTDATPYGEPKGSAPSGSEQKAGTPARTATAPSHGFGEAIAWRHLDEGMAEAKAEGRPLMLVVHASWCSQCKALKPAFSDERLAELSERFVMVNADQDQTPVVQSYGPDGTYIPRVLFFDPATGNLDESLRNPQRSRYHYYYGPQDDLPAMMEKALERYGERS